MPSAKRGGIPVAAFWEERARALVAEERCRGLEALIAELRDRLAAATSPPILFPPAQPGTSPFAPWPTWPPDTAGSTPTAPGFSVTAAAALATAEADAPAPAPAPAAPPAQRRPGESPVLWL